MEKYIYHAKLSRIAVLAADFSLLYLACGFSHLVCFGEINFMANYGYLFILFALSWWIVSGLSENIYHINRFRHLRKSGLDLLSAFCLHLLLVFVCLASLGQQQIPQPFLSYLYTLAAIFIFASRLAWIVVYRYYRNLDYGKSRKVVIVGTNQSGRALHRFFTFNSTAGHRFLGFFDNAPSDHVHKGLVKGGLEELKSFCLSESIDEIYFTLPLNDNKALIDELARFADDNFVYFRIVPDFSAIVQRDVNMYFMDSIPVITIRKEPLEIVFNKIIKRIFDVVFSSAVILVIFPVVLPIIALSIKLASKGPVFFTQMRPGKKNRLFKCYKFRTMRINQQTEQQATKNDPRVTRIGAFLRKTNLDELPQFFNVLLGDMSVVGPRPNMINQLEEYSKVIEQYKIRHFVNPGITGYAQVNGYRGETKQLALMQKRVEYDVMYMENWSFFLDLKIIVKTVWNMVKGEKNAY